MPSDAPIPPDDSPGDPDPSALPVAPDPSIPGDPAPTGPIPLPESAPGDPSGGEAAPAPSDTPGDAGTSGEGGLRDAAHPVVRTDDPPQGPALQTALALDGPVIGADLAHDAGDEGIVSGDVSSGQEPDTAAVGQVPDAALRVAEALIFASATPVPAGRLAPLLPEGTDPRALLAALAARTAGRGVTLTQVAGGWAFRTAPDLAPALTTVVEVPRRLPRAAMEALAIIAWHQPVTRPEIEEIRGASLSQTTLEILLENGLVAPRGKKEAPGRPTLWGTTPRFLDQFALNSLRDLPRREELLPEPGLPLALPDPAPTFATQPDDPELDGLPTQPDRTTA